jgi:hypothetical protein
MKRVLILLTLAIALMAYALDSSWILQAKKISDTSVTVIWNALPDAAKYRVFYDETLLMRDSKVDPLFDTEFTDENEIKIDSLSPDTEYTFLVRGYAEDDTKLDVSIPLHVKTFATIKPQLQGSVDVVDSRTLRLTFTAPVDTKATLNLEDADKKLRVIESIKHDPEDLRILLVTLQSPFEESKSYSLWIKKVPILAGNSLVFETPFAVQYPQPNNLVPPDGFDDISEVVPDPIVDNIDTVPEPVIKTEPVPIDTLPRTGAGIFLLLLIASSCAVVFLLHNLKVKSQN